MAIVPKIIQTKVNLAKVQNAGKEKPKKILSAGKGRALRNLDKVLNRMFMTSMKNPEKTGKFRFLKK